MIIMLMVMATTAVKGYNTGDDLVRCAVKLHVSEIVRQHLKGDRTALDTATKTTTAATTAVEDAMHIAIISIYCFTLV